MPRDGHHQKGDMAPVFVVIKTPSDGMLEAVFCDCGDKKHRHDGDEDDGNQLSKDRVGPPVPRPSTTSGVKR